MKKLLINCFLFLLPLLMLLIFLPVDRRLMFQELKNDCFNHAIWIYDRICNNPKPSDIVFLGSSSTINGVNDRIIEERLSADTVHVVNLGYCRLGRNLAYSLFKELCREKQVRYLILEVRRGEDRFSHPVFPYMATTPDVLTANPFFNKDLLSDIFTHLSYKVELTQEVLFKKITHVPLQESMYGHASSPDTIETGKLRRAKESRSNIIPQPSKIKRYVDLRFPEIYLKKINRLCQKEGAEIVFLYIPVYGVDAEHPLELKTYLKYGRVLIPPSGIFLDETNWYDEDHLNEAGSEKLSSWLSDEIRKFSDH